ncbi:molybdopterin molybdotransferase MoeA [Arthrobacter sp. H14-L1]|uniref:molybdopterin molybdotransferase MoeA n=1 Tax=Arthrobacter sp. H14-L1 TaxID=2996697 RepID=UPI00226F869B|nr:molybdopterin molybdotransferase MoeA [Arthrobacter sp. H14-L1]MCY0904808.1 molybdopterin molybdotransferase MoeA [Arthrobacter sp. H14-L1]
MPSAEPAPAPSVFPASSVFPAASGLPGPRVSLPYSWDEARARAYDCVVPLPAHSVSLDQGIGRILAQDITALQDIPHYASSAMDGWSVAGSPPWILAETGHRLSSGQAAPVVTGGLIPAGTKAVLRSESGQLSRDADGLPVLVLSESARPGEPKGGQHIRRPAEEARAGEVMVRSGQTLNPVHIAVAALAGLDEVQVLGQPSVKLIFTGDEVVSAGLPEPGQVRDTFSPQLAAVVRMLGGAVLEQQRVADSLAAMTAALEDSVDDPADVIITTGATGRSSADFLRAAVAGLGGTMVIDGIAMRPGHPTLLAEFPDGRLLVGLPGNPLAAMMGLLTVAAPLLARLGSRELPVTGEVFCGSPIGESPGRTRLLPYRLVYGLASPTKFADSGMLRGLAAADGVMLVPPHGAKMGEAITAIPLPWQRP